MDSINIEHLLKGEYALHRPNSREHSQTARTRTKGRLHLLLNGCLDCLKRSGKYRQSQVKQRYDQAYQYNEENVRAEYQDNYALSKRKVTYALKDKSILVASNNDVQQAIAQFLARRIAQLKPKKLLEIGSGNGRVTMTVANQLSDADMTGLELSQKGVDMSNAMLKAAMQDTQFAKLYGLDFDHIKNNTIRFVQGSADHLPFPDNSFDMVYSFDALEQTHAIADQVLAEAARVCSRYWVMKEPFWEANDFLGRQFLILKGYWRKKISDIEKHGFKLVEFADNLPAKITFNYGLAIFEKQTQTN